jgi:hypothetical protein
MPRLLRLLLMALAAAITLVILLYLNAPRAHGDVGGAVPAPGLCEYPAVCGSGNNMNVYYYWEDFPTELNGSHRHCEWGGAMIQGNVGVSILMFNAGISGNIGGLNGSCSYRCPDMSMAEMPNPPGGWKDAIRPIKCRSIGPNPNEVPAPVSDPVGSVPASPEPPPAVLLPSVTDPTCPNPDATTNAGCGGTTP